MATTQPIDELNPQPGALSTAVGPTTSPQQTEMPAPRQVDVATETTGGQLSKMLGEGSSYLDVARTGAAKQANQRGLLNTSIAAGAGEEAAIRAATPIAAQDAGVFERKALGDQQFSQQIQLADKAYQQQTGLNDQQFTNQKAFEEIRVKNQETLMKVDSDNREKFATLEREHQATMQNNASAVNLYGNTVQAISSILSNPDLSPAQQQAGVNKQVEFLNNGLALVGSISGDDIVFPTISSSAGTSAPSYLNSGVQAEGGLAPGQAKLNTGYGSPPDLSPGSFLGEQKKISERVRNTSGGDDYNVDTYLQWTPEGWKRV